MRREGIDLRRLSVRGFSHKPSLSTTFDPSWKSDFGKSMKNPRILVKHGTIHSLDFSGMDKTSLGKVQ